MPAPDPATSVDGQGAAASILGRAREALAADRPHTLADVAASSGLDHADLRRLFAAAQRLRVDDAYADADLDYADDLAVLVARSDVEVVERELRLRLRLVTQIVVNDLSTIRLDSVIGRLLEQGASPDELGEQVVVLAAEVLPAVERQLAADYRAALLRLLDSDVVSQVAEDVDRLPTVAVGFVDLVGFTRLSAQTDPDGVGTVLTSFETLAAEVVDARDDVMLAKTIGDAVMLVGGSVDEVAEALLTIVEATPPDLVDIQRRTGMGWGEVLVREGDYVGTTVNTAARLTDLARPGSLVVSPEAAEALDDERWALSRLRPHHLKGLGTLRAVRVRRAQDD